MSGLSVSWRFALVSLRFSLAYEARRSPQWKIRDFPLGATALDGPPVEGGPLGFLFRSGAPDQAGFFTREASGDRSGLWLQLQPWDTLCVIYR